MNTPPPDARMAAPTVKWLYGAYAPSRALQARPTSSSTDPSPGSLNAGLGLFRLVPRDQHLLDPSTLHLLGREREIAVRDGLPLGGNGPQKPVHQPGNGVPFL